jgi:uncharacterized protein YigA (DUF484 family)
MSASNEKATEAQSRAAQDVTAKLSDEAVREYLQDHEDFLQRNPDLLNSLQIPHASGSAVSLVEKQVGVLRERNVDLRHRLTALTANGKENDKLYDQTRTLVLKLIEADSIAALSSTFVDSMTSDFGVDHASMILFGESDGTEAYRVDTRENAKTAIGGLLKGNGTVCGALREAELKYLFPTGGEMGSAALTALSGNELLGLIAVGSSDASRYSSTIGTLFVSHIADVIVQLLARLNHKAA